MATERKEITSLKSAPEGYEWQPGRSRDPSTPHPAFNSRAKGGSLPWQTSEDDAEATAELPERAHAPARCPHCGSQFITEQPPLDGDPRGMATCNTCSRQVCWLRPPLRTPSRPVSSPAPPRVALPAPSAPSQCTLRPVISGRFNRQDGCGPACSTAYGHDAASHEEHGRSVARAEIEAKPTGVVRTGCLTLDLDTLDVTVNGRVARLPNKESEILAYLAVRIGKLCPRSELIGSIWGREQVEIWGRGHSSGLNAYLARLRGSLGPAAALIESVPARGLILRKEPPVDDTPRDRPRPRLRPGRLHHRLALRPGRDGGLVVAGSRRRGGAQQPFFRRREEHRTMSTTNGTATIEPVAAAVAQMAPASVVAEVMQATALTAETTPAPGAETLLAEQPAPTPTPVERVSALEAADRWYADVRQLRDALADEEAELATRLDRLRDRRAKLDRVVAIFEAPEAMAIASAPTPAPAATRRSWNGLAPGQWARKFERCQDCGTTERPHKAHGLCASCEPKHRLSKEHTS